MATKTAPKNPGQKVGPKPGPKSGPDSGGDHDRFAHIIWHPEPGRAAAIITTAIVNGTPVVALCGKLWIPSRDAARFPVCLTCLEIKKALQANG